MSCCILFTTLWVVGFLHGINPKGMGEHFIELPFLIIAPKSVKLVSFMVVNTTDTNLYSTIFTDRFDYVFQDNVIYFSTREM